MKTSDFYYDLPKERIAQVPLETRSTSKLMVIDKADDSIVHTEFSQIVKFLREGDCLVLNETRVIPARLFGKKRSGAVIEIFLLKRLQGDVWECMVRPSKRLKQGDEVLFEIDGIKAIAGGYLEDGLREIRFEYEGIFEELLDRLGVMPLPPYIHETLEDGERYQTVYNHVRGSVAAPTAGLHFTRELLDEVKEMGVKIAKLTLHVGLGTFRPVQVEDVQSHKMHEEWYCLDEENAAIIRETKASGGRVICVGTTSTRTLETIWQKYAAVIADQGWSDIFIYPGFRFGVIDGLITNFHLPESTLLMLVSAFYEKEKVLDAYRIAVEREYRFFSFGDAMFLSDSKVKKLE